MALGPTGGPKAKVSHDESAPAPHAAVRAGLAESACPRPHDVPKVPWPPDSQGSPPAPVELSENELVLPLIGTFRVNARQTAAFRIRKVWRTHTAPRQDEGSPGPPLPPLQPQPLPLTDLPAPATSDLRPAHPRRPRATPAVCSLSRSPQLTVPVPPAGH